MEKKDGKKRVLREWSDIFAPYPSRIYNKGETIVDQAAHSEYVYLICKGLVEFIYTDIDGEEHLINLGAAGESYGVPELFTEEHVFLGTMRALTDAVIKRIPPKEMFRALDDNANLWRGLMRESTRITSDFVKQRFDSSQNADRRVEEMLYKVAQALSREQGTKRNIRIPLNQTDIARLADTTRVTAAKHLKRLKDRNLLDITYGGLLIWDLEQLARCME